MKHNVNAAVDIFHTRVAYQSHLYTYFFDVAVVLFINIAMGRPKIKKNLTKRSGAGSAVFKSIIPTTPVNIQIINLLFQLLG